MARKKTRGRQKIEIKRIENEEDRLVTFSKRRSGIYKKACEISTMCGAEVAVVVFSPSGKPFSYGHPSVEAVTKRFMNQEQEGGDDPSQALVEAYRQVKMTEITNRYNQVDAQLDAAKARSSALHKRLSSLRGGQAAQHRWWEAPFENLDLEGLKKLYASYETHHNNLLTHLARDRGCTFTNNNPIPNTYSNPNIPYPFPPNFCYGSSSRNHF